MAKKKRRWLRILAYVALGLVALTLVLAIVLRVRYGGGDPFPDRSGRAERRFSELEVAAELDAPPGNIAVSAHGRVFFTFHPEGRPETKLAELVRGRPRAYP